MRPSDPPEPAAGALSQHHRAEVTQTPWEMLFEISPDAIFVTDSLGSIRDANPHAEQLFGYPVAELRGQPLDSLVSEDIRTPHSIQGESATGSIMRKMGAALKLFGLHREGNRIPVEITFKPLETESGPVVLAFVHDVSLQWSSRESTRRFANLFEFSPDGILVADREGMIHDSNPRARELFGYDEEEFQGMFIESLVPERYRGRHAAHREGYMADPSTRRMGAAMNLFGLRKDGS